MKIGPIETKPAAATPAIDRKGGSSSSQPTQAVEASAKVDLSAAAQSVVAPSTAEFDGAKVERIAQAIRDGSYRINADAIADKLISNASELLGRPNQ